MGEKIKPFDINDGDLTVRFSGGCVEISMWHSDLDIPPLTDKEFLDLKRFVDEVYKEKFSKKKSCTICGNVMHADTEDWVNPLCPTHFKLGAKDWNKD